MDMRLHFPSQGVYPMVKSFTDNLHTQSNDHNNITLGATLHLNQTISEKNFNNFQR